MIDKAYKTYLNTLPCHLGPLAGLGADADVAGHLEARVGNLLPCVGQSQLLGLGRFMVTSGALSSINLGNYIILLQVDLSEGVNYRMGN